MPGFPVTATAFKKTGMYVAQCRIGRINLLSACYNRHEVLAMVAADLARRGEDAAVRARLKAHVISVRAFLQERYGIFTGPREYFHDSWMTPDRADLKDFLWACRRARTACTRNFGLPCLMMRLLRWNRSQQKYPTEKRYDCRREEKTNTRQRRG